MHEDFPPKLLWSENADLKFGVNNEGDTVRADSPSVFLDKSTYLGRSKESLFSQGTKEKETAE